MKLNIFTSGAWRHFLLVGLDRGLETVEDEGDAPDNDPDEENELNEDDAHEEYAASADVYPDSYEDEGAEEMREKEE